MHLWEFNYEIVQGDILKASFFQQHVARVALDVDNKQNIPMKKHPYKVCLLFAEWCSEWTSRAEMEYFKCEQNADAAV